MSKIKDEFELTGERICASDVPKENPYEVKEEDYCKFCGTDEVETFCKCNDDKNQYNGEE